MKTAASLAESRAIEFSTPWTHEARSSGGPPIALTDLGNSERLVLAHGNDLRFLAGTRQWFAFDGRRFAPDETAEVKRRAKAAMRAILLEASVQDDDVQRRQLIAHQIRSESDRSIRAAISLAESDEKIASRARDFDSDPFVLNVLNGTIDLRTRLLRRHLREDLITKLAPVEFDAKAPAPTWESFLREIMDGDAEKISFLRRAVGYSLTGDVSEHVFFLLHGTGANGKSTFLETLRFVFGDYAAQTEFSTFLATKNGGVRNDIARLRGARIVTAVESDAGRRLAENVLKSLTGGDVVAARFLYSEYFEFRPAFKLWLATNNRPRIVGQDEAIWRRVRLVPFSVTVPEERRDPELLDKLKLEASGILNWALAGLADWRARGLAAPSTITHAGADYRQREDAFGRFLEECLIADRDSETRASDLYKVYREWTDSNGELPAREKDFSESLVQRGFTKHRKSAGYVWKAIQIRLDRVSECMACSHK